MYFLYNLYLFTGGTLGHYLVSGTDAGNPGVREVFFSCVCQDFAPRLISNPYYLFMLCKLIGLPR